MKVKKFNILFIVMIICFVFVGMPKVEAADSSRYCSYSKGKENFKVELSSDGSHVLKTDNVFTSGTDTDLDKIFIVDGDAIYCPEKIYFNTLSIESDRYQIVRYLDVYPANVSDLDSPATWLLSVGSDVVKYDYGFDQDENGNKKIKICKPGGKGILESIIKGYDNALASNEAKLTEDDIREMTSEERDAAYKGLHRLYEQETRKDENEEYVQVKIINEGLENTCFKAHDDFKTLYESYLTKSEEYRNKLFNILKILSEIRVEEGKTTEEEHSTFVDTMYDAFIEIDSQNQVLMNELPVSDSVFSCEGLIADELEAVIKLALRILRIGAPIILIVLCAIDFSQVVISNDQDALKKASSKVVKRMLAALGLFLVPLFVSVAIDLIDDSNPNLNCTEVMEE